MERASFAKLLTSFLLILPLTAVYYLARSVGDMPFPAFDVMDLMIRVLPGGIITFGIDTMTDLILAFNPDIDLDSAAKTSERWIAVFQFIGLGTLAGLLYIWISEQLHKGGQFLPSAWVSGLTFGLLVGALLALVSAQYNTSSGVGVGQSSLWIMLGAMAWGLALNGLQRHLLADSPTPAGGEVTILDRRQFLIRTSAITASITLVGAGLGEWLKTEEETIRGTVDVSDLLMKGLQPAPGTRPEYTPLPNHYRIDINTGDAPEVDPESYRMKVVGLVAQDLEVSLADIRAYAPVNQFVTLSCISNRIGGRLISTTRWTGVPMKTLLADWGVSPSATHIKITSFDGFDEVVAIDLIQQDERIMLAYEWDGIPLPPKHGFPLRIYIPDRYGMKQPKWIEKMQFLDAPQEGYWVRRGWSKEAFVNSTSVIDTIAVDASYEQGGKTYIPIGGIAYSGAKGISKVEVQVDEGPWQAAELREPLSQLSWRVWRLDWEASNGRHIFRVRTYDQAGELQTDKESSPRPDGATGYHREQKTI